MTDRGIFYKKQRNKLLSLSGIEMPASCQWFRVRSQGLTLYIMMKVTVGVANWLGVYISDILIIDQALMNYFWTYIKNIDNTLATLANSIGQ